MFRKTRTHPIIENWNSIVARTPRRVKIWNNFFFFLWKKPYVKVLLHKYENCSYLIDPLRRGTRRFGEYWLFFVLFFQTKISDSYPYTWQLKYLFRNTFRCWNFQFSSTFVWISNSSRRNNAFLFTVANFFAGHIVGYYRKIKKKKMIPTLWYGNR